MVEEQMRESWGWLQGEYQHQFKDIRYAYLLEMACRIQFRTWQVYTFPIPYPRNAGVVLAQ